MLKDRYDLWEIYYKIGEIEQTTYRVKLVHFLKLGW